jgi:O2-independent ubiquinone biosynthesis protein UbiU
MRPSRGSLELVCPAGNPAAFEAAVNAGADSIYCGYADETNARNFPGLNFSREEMRAAIARAHRGDVNVLVAINTFPRPGALELWQSTVDEAVAAGADALILADLGLMAWVAERHPGMRIHLSVQAAASNPEAINFCVERFGIRRVVLPRVLSVAEIAKINGEIGCETEVFVFGGLCVMAEGRCLLSSYATGRSPNMQGVCSPASHVEYLEIAGELVSRLGGLTINKAGRNQPVGYPTICKGRFVCRGSASHVFEDPTSLDAAKVLPALKAAGVRALKIEGRQRSRAYAFSVVKEFRRAVDALDAGRPIDASELMVLAEGLRGTSGAYHKTWR